ncbi:hypothetical protein QVD17_32261 [Tagetes erecta]|uniref:Uncharacterized protein n=1 Tax=Tagetes erecta TaxID=13708 RepID=A0AAD8KBG0_TARER|nr:hypothetical protein QVD17_32261 [Tagetes erecta]
MLLFTPYFETSTCYTVTTLFPKLNHLTSPQHIFHFFNPTQRNAAASAFIYISQLHHHRRCTVIISGDQPIHSSIL